MAPYRSSRENAVELVVFAYQTVRAVVHYEREFAFCVCTCPEDCRFC